MDVLAVGGDAVRAAVIAQHGGNAGAVALDLAHTVQGIHAAEHGQGPGIAYRAHHAGVAAIDGGGDACQVFIGFAADRGHEFEVATGFRCLQQQGHGELALIVVPGLVVAGMQINQVQVLEFIGHGVERLVIQDLPEELGQRAPLEQRAAAGAPGNRITCKLVHAVVPVAPPRVVLRQCRIVEGEVGIAPPVLAIGHVLQAQRFLTHGGDRLFPHETGEVAAAVGFELGAAGCDQRLAFRRIEAVDGITLEIDQTGGGRCHGALAASLRRR